MLVDVTIENRPLFDHEAHRITLGYGSSTPEEQAAWDEIWPWEEKWGHPAPPDDIPHYRAIPFAGHSDRLHDWAFVGAPDACVICINEWVPSFFNRTAPFGQTPFEVTGVGTGRLKVECQHGVKMTVEGDLHPCSSSCSCPKGKR